MKIIGLLFSLLLYSQLNAATYTVINTNDSGAGSLRDAISSANAAPGADLIQFNIPAADGHYNASQGTWTINLFSQLPMITTGSINIDATTQADSNHYGPEIILTKGSTFDYPLLIVSPGNAVKGFIIQGFPYGIMLANSTATGNTVSNNYLGTNYNGTVAAPNDYGIGIAMGASGNYISNNLISGNSFGGIGISSSNNNYIRSNLIGTDPSGQIAVPNLYGIAIDNSSGTQIGGSTYRNIVSGNLSGGIVVNGLSSSGTIIKSNYIGTDSSGLLALPNENGILLSFGNHCTIGGSVAADRNIISGNTAGGIMMNGTGTRANVVKGNYIGTDKTGLNPLPNYSGIVLKSQSNSNIFGGITVGERNILSGNIEMGLYIEASDSNIITGNYIGPDVTGTTAFMIGDSMLQSNGIEFNTVAKHNRLGGYLPEERNVISGNRVYGMVYYGNTSYNPVIGNYIGTDATGSYALPNATGICVDGGSNHNSIINNVLSGNLSYGIFIVTTGTYYNEMKGNLLGTNAAGTDTIPNAIGLLIGGGTKYNVIGGSGAGEGNLFSGNRFEGIEIADMGTDSNVIVGNYIGTDITGTTAIPNYNGIGFATNPSYNTVDQNVISGNTSIGLILFEYSNHNVITRNRIGVASDGVTPLGNGKPGIVIYGGASYNQIGMEPDMGNIIANNDTAGILIDDDNSIGNTISANSIYSNGMLGIELMPGGPTMNDAGDADTGPNNLMNYPIIIHAAADAIDGTAWITGTLDSPNPDQCVVEVFLAQANTFGFGDGFRYVGYNHPDAAGNWSLYVSGALTDGDVITATATGPDGSTSEFAANVSVITGIDEETISNWVIYPNPVEDLLFVPGTKGMTLQVYSMDGRLVLETVSDNTLDVAALQPGLYMLFIQHDAGRRLSFVKQ